MCPDKDIDIGTVVVVYNKRVMGMFCGGVVLGRVVGVAGGKCGSIRVWCGVGGWR